VTFGEILKQFKEGADAENIVPLVEDESLRSGVVAWKSVVVKHIGEAGAECQAKDLPTQWNWLWEQVSFDIPTFGVVAGCRAQDATTLFTRLRGLRLIYPDGTIHEYATQYLQAMILSKLNSTKRAKKV